MKKFCYKFLIVLLSIGMLVPTWLTIGVQKAKAAAPTVTVNTLITNDQRPELTGTVDDNTAIMIIYVGTKGYTGVSITGLSSPYTWTLPNDTITPDLLEGVYNITASATNPDGSSIDPTSDELTIDLTAPVVDLTAPVDNARVNGDSIINFTDSELTNPECSVDNTNYSSCTTGISKISDLMNFTSIPDGSFSLYLRDTDVAGNTGNDNINLIKDTTTPAAPANLVASVGNREVSLTWDAVIGADYYNIYYQKFSDSVYSGPIATTQTSAKITRLENGAMYRFIVRAVRIVGTDAIESANAWIEATPIAPKVVFAAAPVEIIEEPVPETPEVQPIPPTIEEPAEEGKILGEETPTETETEKINWTPWIILFILIILAGAATGGYFYWFGREEEEIISKEVVEKSKEPAKRGRKSTKTPVKRNKRW